MSNIKTVVHAYYFNTSNAEEKVAYEALSEKLKARGSKCFETWGGSSHYQPQLDGVEVELETKHLFGNQWNTAPISGKGYRLFDWAQDYPIKFGANIKRGHYLELTTEMIEVRHSHKKCGYCGNMLHESEAKEFCEKCIDSEYLEEKDLFLTRMKRIDDVTSPKPLLDVEKEYLIPKFSEAQLHGSTARGKARIAKERADLLTERDKTIKVANIKYDGMLWMMDHGVSTGNVIYYSHTNMFSFGWRKPIDKGIVDDLHKLMEGFPFEYEVKS
jgi:hypothetical protein